MPLGRTTRTRSTLEGGTVGIVASVSAWLVGSIVAVWPEAPVAELTIVIQGAVATVIAMAWAWALDRFRYRGEKPLKRGLP